MVGVRVGITSELVGCAVGSADADAGVMVGICVGMTGELVGCTVGGVHPTDMVSFIISPFLSMAKQS
jgi:hypothetical protein